MQRVLDAPVHAAGLLCETLHLRRQTVEVVANVSSFLSRLAVDSMANDHADALQPLPLRAFVKVRRRRQDIEVARLGSAVRRFTTTHVPKQRIRRCGGREETPSPTKLKRFHISGVSGVSINPNASSRKDLRLQSAIALWAGVGRLDKYRKNFEKYFDFLLAVTEGCVQFNMPLTRH